MAKFEEYLNSTSLTFSDLSDSTKRKIERFENLYQAYSDAYDAEDYKTSDNYEGELSKLDLEIKGLIESEYKPAKAKRVDVKKEEPKAEEPKVEEPKTEEPKTEEPKAEEPKVEEKKTSSFNIGMFDL